MEKPKAGGQRENSGSQIGCARYGNQRAGGPFRFTLPSSRLLPTGSSMRQLTTLVLAVVFLSTAPAHAQLSVTAGSGVSLPVASQPVADAYAYGGAFDVRIGYAPTKARWFRIYGSTGFDSFAPKNRDQDAFTISGVRTSVGASATVDLPGRLSVYGRAGPGLQWLSLDDPIDAPAPINADAWGTAVTLHAALGLRTQLTDAFGAVLEPVYRATLDDPAVGAVGLQIALTIDR